MTQYELAAEETHSLVFRCPSTPHSPASDSHGAVSNYVSDGADIVADYDANGVLQARYAYVGGQSRAGRAA